MTEQLRIGVAGAGPWARVHADHVHAHPGTRLTAVWARRPEAAAALAEPRDAVAVGSWEALFDACDAVVVALPPDVQPDLAVAAAGAGRHLLLEKPLALDLADAERIDAAVRQAGVASLLMLTRRYQPATRTWLQRVADELGGVDGVVAQFLSGAFLGGDFATPWRLREGALPDLGPHTLDLLEQAGGRIVHVRATRNDAGAVVVSSRHEGGAAGSAVMSGRTGGRDVCTFLAFSDRDTLALTDPQPGDPSPFDVALTELCDAVASGAPVTADARRGLELQRLLAACERSIAAGGATVAVG